MSLVDAASMLLVATGVAFLLLGSLGLLRLPDVFCRLHAVSKVDNLGLGFIVLGMLLQADGFAEALKLLLIWIVALASSTTASHLVAHFALRTGVRPWERGR
ncbi:MAG TPA: monovalent cation/H(+) antiporter subunit G [Pelomicrobium sp.]|nr:monovalent cation/H(+) antiporter subunit G [Pelomicrobium sp.]